MAINPLARLSNFDVPTFPASAARADPSTFNNLASIGDAVGLGIEHRRVADILRGASDEQGNLDFNKAGAELAKAGLTQYAEPFFTQANRRQALGQAGQELSERERHNRASEDAARTAKVPYGWETGPDGTLMPSPGGPASPEYLEKVAKLKEKPREFSMSDITKLSEEGGKFANVKGFGQTFEDRFAPGYIHPAVGAAVNTAGRFLPEGVVGKDVADSSTWWQGYDRYKQVVRNNLYGASLQPSEQRDFEKADISPGMQPKQIRKNLDIQQTIVGNGLRRKANAAIASGYDPVAISKAYGLDLSELGVDASGRRGSVAPIAPVAPATSGGVPPPPPGFVIR